MDNLTKADAAFAKLELVELIAGKRELHQCSGLLRIGKAVESAKEKREVEMAEMKWRK